jgi:hypothetical protein
MCSGGKFTDVDGREMCRHDTADLQRWLHYKVRMQVGLVVLRKVSKERGENAKAAFSPLNPLLPLTALEERGKERPAKNPILNFVQIDFQKRVFHSFIFRRSVLTERKGFSSHKYSHRNPHCGFPGFVNKSLFSCQRRGIGAKSHVWNLPQSPAHRTWKCFPDVSGHQVELRAVVQQTDLCVLLGFAILAAIDFVTMFNEHINFKLEWLPAEFFRAP